MRVWPNVGEVKETVGGVVSGTKLAVIFVVELIVKLHGLPELLHEPPCHLENLYPNAGVAVNVTGVPVAKTSLQSVPQFIPSPLTEPLPLTLVVNAVLVTLNCKLGLKPGE